MMDDELLTLVPTGDRPYVFVSYSHLDEPWKNALLPQLKHLQDVSEFKLWDDRDIEPGVDWYAEIKHVLRRTKVAICLISSKFLTSRFCIDEEVAYLLQARNRGDLEIIPVLVEDCVWQPHRWLNRLQMLPRDGKSITTNFKDNPAEVFSAVAYQVNQMLQPGYVRERPEPAGKPPEKVDIRNLPEKGGDPEERGSDGIDLLFGRTRELNELDSVWDSDARNVAVYVASGGIGKTSLVNNWLRDMAQDNYRGAKRVFAWSFYSQGTTQDGRCGRVTSADEFISYALGWFGDKTKGEGLSLWDRGTRLAGLIQQQKTLLILDGLEPLQSGQTVDRGKILDPGLEALLDELGRKNPGLCLITTREKVTDLWHEKNEVSVGQRSLDTISTIAGRALLRVGGIEGNNQALEKTVEAFGKHAYAVKLLGSFLTWRETPDIEHAADIPERAEIDEKDGKHPRRVMAAFAEQFGDSAKADILAMLGLFDRPADAGCIAALRKEPAVPGLNAAVLPISEAVWQEQVAELRKLGLLTHESRHAPDELDAHPLVREHFGAGLRDEREEAWKAGHERLYEHLKTAPEKDQPDTLAEMAPLFQAVHHGCQARQRQEAFDEVYQNRVDRNGDAYLVKRLGAFGANLGLVASFFDPPFEHPAADLTEPDRAYLLNDAAFLLRALGRLGEAVAPMQASLKGYVEQENWAYAARIASNLSELQLTLGEVAAAVASGEAAVKHADRSGDAFQRMSKRTTLADARHQAGDVATAQALFEEAEGMQADFQPAYPRLYSFQGYRYCDLLLTLGQAEAVRERARQFFEWRVLSDSLLDIALDHLSLARAAMAQGDRDEARRQLDQAVDGLREAGRIDNIPRGLLARAALFREVEKYGKSRRDLDEAMRIASRSGMRLHECDAHLEFSRLEIKQGQPDKARVHFTSAAKLVEDCGYHRRDGDVAELKKELGL